jgi:hypothetical protein
MRNRLRSLDIFYIGYRVNGRETGRQQMVINGELVPYDGITGCNFKIQTIDDPNPESRIKAYVQLFSPADGMLLDEKLMFLDEVSEWLYNRKDW